ncbi:MAG: diguanylate cyclase [Proteobacteria bacterium]|nr:diguanylate cyclase [Pseudomonadota bacterium]
MRDAWMPALVAGAMVYLALALALVRNRPGPGARAIGAALFAIAIWVAMAVVESRTPTLGAYLLAAKIKYTAIALVPPLFFLFFLEYTERMAVRARHVALVLLLPVVTIGLTWTNESHEWMWAHPPLDADGALSARMPWGPWFWWVHIPYSYLLTAGAMAVLVAELWRESKLYRSQALLLLVGILLPLTANVLFTSGLVPPIGRIGPTPFAFAISGLLFSWGFVRGELFKLAPIAYRAVFEHMEDGVFVADTQGRVANTNTAALQIMRRPRESVIGYRIEDALPEHPELAAALRSLNAVTLACATDDGRNLELRISPLRGESGKERGRVVLLRDVTLRERAAAAQRDNEALLFGIVENSPNGILRLQPKRGDDGVVRDFICVFANPAAAAQIGRPRAELVGRPFKGAVHPHTAALFQVFREAFQSGERREIERSVMRDGREAWLRFIAVAAGDDLVVTFFDLTERKHRELAMEAAAAQDSLTGLLNRRGFEADAPALLLRPDGEPNPSALLYVDLDRFKEVNDTLGHEVGDLLLCEFAARMQRCTRGPDLLARFGGDEFVLLLLDSGVDGALWVAERLLASAREPVRIGEHELLCVPSVGIALFPEHGLELKQLLQAADRAMYDAKSRGGGLAVIAPLGMAAR